MLGFLKRILLKRNQFDKDRNLDVAAVRIGDLTATMVRRVSDDVPYEYSLYIPRLELRRKIYSNGQLTEENELILNSLTIVHAPQHPPAESGRVWGSRTACHKMD